MSHKTTFEVICIFFDKVKKWDSFTMEDDNSFWLLAKNLKKRSFKARSDKDSLNILGYIYPVLHPHACQVLLSSWRWSTG